MRKIAALCVLLLMIAVQSDSRAQAGAAVSAGVKIGTIVKDAVTTAFPAVSSIIDAIWKNKSSGGDKISKDQLGTAVTNAQADLKKQFAASIQSKLVPVGQRANELELVQRFIQPAVVADQQILLMHAELLNAAPQWSSVKSHWSQTKAQLDKVKSITDTDINGKVSDFWLRDKLLKIRGLQDTAVISIDANLASATPDLSQLRDDTGKISDVLGDISVVAGYEIADLQGDLADLSKWAQAAAGGTTPVNQAQEEFRKILDSRIP